MIVSVIVAAAKNRVIGMHNQIPWYLPADLKYFKKITTNHHVIMGRNTFNSIGRPLPNRTNVIVTRDIFFAATDCLVAHSVDEALELAYDNGEMEAFIIGGGQIYEQSQEYWDKIYLTEVNLEPEGEVFFPEINLKEWRLTFKEPHRADDKNEMDYTFKVYDRIETKE
ncbi:dihydrofolate reductase [Haliscomenobacter hydrossis]|uniref:Dihydrofolate reductase n=1 Tax=Haliscomenobacter hydrossis (strain ATCC 27775 / DSM 1100 / LMG 10767 / O) TaxID=760192 RepID=F4KXP6_HALH1|nr:dihydrofolate reductase [Haliscomenobacter hydrossis]AEE51407.1 Dihydrofolate reductase [Haliscomenobacter hydrossis DSM 1100]